MKIDRICIDCGITFLGGYQAPRCPECKRLRGLERSREYFARVKKGTHRPLGSIDICPVCKKTYTITSATQKYCKPCGVVMYKLAMREASADRRLHGNHQERLARYADWKTRRKSGTPWTQREKNKLARLLKQGFNHQECAEILFRSLRAVETQAQNLEAPSPRQWTEKTVAILIALLKEGKTHLECAEALKRSVLAVKVQAHRLRKKGMLG